MYCIQTHNMSAKKTPQMKRSQIKRSQIILSNGTNLDELITLGSEAWILNRQQLTQDDFVMICRTLPQTKITTLLLGNNDIHDISPLADVLRNNTTLKYVVLFSNKITHFPTCLIEALQHNKTLRKIDLDDNIIDISNLDCLETEGTLSIRANRVSLIDKTLLNMEWAQAKQTIYVH